MADIRFIETGSTPDDEHLLLTGSSDTNVKLWDMRAKDPVATFKDHTQGVNCGRFSPDGEWIVTGSDDGDIIIWDIST